MELYPLDKQAKRLRKQQPTCKKELYAYFAVQIYIGITIESCIKDYQKDLNAYGCEHIVKIYIGLKRFQQLERHFQALLLQLKDDITPKNTFTRINELAKYIQLTYQKLYTSKTYLTINKITQCFIGYAFKVVNILSKYIPEGSKIQVLINKGYILDFMWYKKGNKKGLVNLDISFIKEGFLKTQAVVLNLLF